MIIAHNLKIKEGVKVHAVKTECPIQYNNQAKWNEVVEFYQYLVKPQISSAYQLDKDTPMSTRLEMAQCFLSNKEYHFDMTRNISLFNDVEAVLKAKVLAYAIAFAKGATNGGMLFQYARADLLTWRAIYEGATFVNGWLC